MIISNRKFIHYFFVISLICMVITNYAFSQIGLTPKLFEFSDSTKAKNTVKWLNLKHWNNYYQSDLSLNYFKQNDNLKNNRYHPSNVMPKDPFKLDYRTGSYYVPRMVRDELNLIMNRPKDNAFIPVLGVAFIAAQLAAKYVFVQDKLKISKDNLLNSLSDHEILKELWIKSPQTASELYKLTVFKNKLSLKELNNKINNLIDNKLVKQKNLEDKELQFFPAISNTEYNTLLQKINSDSSINAIDKDKNR